MEIKILPYGKQTITEEDEQAVLEVLRSDFLTQGPKILEFEEKFAREIGSKYAVAVANGTAALHLCTIALDVKEGQQVITSPITFAASANCVRYQRGDVVFVDIDPKTYLIDLNKVEDKLKTDTQGSFIGIIPVDFAGSPVNMEEVKYLADRYNLWIIEDSCHAPGGYFKTRNNYLSYCGNGHYADLAIFSFHPVKHIAAGEGGMITTSDETLYKKLMKLRTHGITRESQTFTNNMEEAYGYDTPSDHFPGWYMEMQDLGYNYRLTDLQAALGLSQLGRLHSSLKRRREIAQFYSQEFNKMSYILAHSGYQEGHAYHLYIIEVANRAELYNYLRKHGIFTQIHYIPTHLMPYYKNLGWKRGDLPHAESYYSRCLSLPMYPALTDEDLNFVVQTIKSFFD